MKFTQWLLRAALLGSAAALLLAGCGGQSDDEVAQLRVVNATSDIASLDLYTGTDLRLQAVAAKTVSDYTALDEATYSVRIHANGSDSILAATDRSLSKETHYTVIAYGRDSSVKTVLLADEESAPTSGTAKVRVFNTATDAGALDLYLTAGTADLDASTPALSVAGGNITSYTEVNKGSYRLRITGNGDNADLRLDLSSITLSDQQVLTLIVTPGSGGVLVHALALNQQGTLTAIDNTQARVRVAAAVNSNATVSAAVGGTALASAQRSPSVGAYALVPAGTQAFAASVNGTALSTTSITTEGGADVTLLVYGDPGAPALSVLSDDNRLPTSSSKAKLRLVHGVGGLGSGLTLTLNYGVIVNDLAVGTASTPNAVTAGSDNTLEVSSPLVASTLYSSSELTLTAQGVYTVFMLGGSASPVGVLRRDR